MNDAFDPVDLGFDERYAIGQPVPRSEDPVLLRGEGHYSDDMSLPGQAFCVVVRSPHAHGVIRQIDVAAARAMPGVLAVYTAADLAKGGIGPLPPRQVMNNRDGTPMLTPIKHVLATDKVRHVGEALAAVIAETLAAAKDAAEAVVVDIDPLPAVSEPAAGAAPGAPLLYDDVPGNVGLDFHYGDGVKVAAAFAAAAHVTRLELRNNRIVVNAMEPRSAIAAYDPECGHWTLHIGCQGVFGFRNYIAGVLGVGRDKVRVLTDRVGGSFGMKQATYPEHYCIMLAARELGRPVKWTDERSGSFISDTHGRDAEMTAELALDKDGNFLAVRLTGYGNLGAAYGAPGPATRNAQRNTLGVYKTPLIDVNTKCVFTTTTPVGAYRGAGRPEANYYMERLVDTAAREMGIDQVELRRQNHIPREAMPYKSPNGTTYDSGDFTGLLNKAVALADWDGFPARRAASRVRGKLRGRGISDYLELTGPPGREMGGKYTFVNDFGVVINPLLVNGQAHGGIVQGIGQALRERVIYDDEGQLLTGSYMDYAMPRADDAPLFVHDFHSVPATTNPLGTKGCGEAGCAGALPSVMNALVDALAEFGIRHIDMPATPERVWRAIRNAK